MSANLVVVHLEITFTRSFQGTVREQLGLDTAPAPFEQNLYKALISLIWQKSSSCKTLMYYCIDVCIGPSVGHCVGPCVDIPIEIKIAMAYFRSSTDIR